MTARLLEGTVAALASVSLAELESAAALLARRDRKYLVPTPLAGVLVARLANGARVLEIDGRRAFRYESVYFDTPERASYLAAVRGRPHRYKVRTRTYLDAGRSMVEVKIRDARGNTIKDRAAHPFELRASLDPAARDFAGGHPVIGAAAAALAPSLVTRYRRTTLLLVADGARLTIDTDLEVANPSGRTARLTGMAIVETKSAGAPSAADRILWALGRRPVRISKFGTGLAVLHPELPANRWTRALAQAWAVDGGPAHPARQVPETNHPRPSRPVRPQTPALAATRFAGALRQLVPLR